MIIKVGYLITFDGKFKQTTEYKILKINNTKTKLIQLNKLLIVFIIFIIIIIFFLSSLSLPSFIITVPFLISSHL